jgi:putative alpha-1,2-mannosidase
MARSWKLLLSSYFVSSTALIELVDPRIGTGSAGFGVGGDPPGAQRPFGALRLSPDTTYIDPTLGQIWLPFNHFGGYYYNDTHVRAFSLTHMVGPGAADWGNFG